MIELYHTGYLEIRDPDLKHGRTNADFGQGFYMSKDGEFSRKWAREKVGSKIIVNRYELDTTGLDILNLTRDRKWFDYIFSNRRGKGDLLAKYDVIVGPIANDTIFDTLGITTSGFLSDEEALGILNIGPCYEQLVIKTERAKANLRWISSETIPNEQVRANRVDVEKEERRFQEQMVKVMEAFQS